MRKEIGRNVKPEWARMMKQDKSIARPSQLQVSTTGLVQQGLCGGGAPHESYSLGG